MLFTRKTPPGGYEIDKEGNLDILRINYEGNLRVPSIENDPSCMAFTVDKLVEVPSASRIIFHQRRNYTYDFNQVQLLVEVANFYNHLIKQKKLFLARGDDPFLSNIKSLVLTLLKSDPLGAFVEIKRLLREAFRLTQDELKGSARLIIYPKAGCAVENMAQARAALDSIWRKARLKNDGR